ncbi:lysophospholipase [Flavimobilis marinus]|uniref:Lysophospholipase, alpha-beta hydrolase superfamily n=1 Tax=Flavimobilis marinus TaxID=285351 RepID=A0A1I2GWI7_9MICO|nr:alpha/beta hydrolase [Flavimobilis marinus]GHG55122.1 lysophospholipase [Flavimobilis marinus]SFF21500.1 Lysophospholipase, alpha-beta hydrolase superfamily [Flavimobilis marinus]
MTTGAEAGWHDDILGPGYRALTLPLADDDEGSVVATLVRFDPSTPEPQRPARAVLYLHGWSDYFFQTGLAEHWHQQGAAFYALDLRKYGRSMRAHQTPCYTDDLAVYDEDIEAALAVIHADLGRRASVMIMAHSTGGLTAALWAHRNPGRVSGLMLNSPWLELQGSAVARTVSTPAIAQLARFQPRTPLPNIDPGFYNRTILKDEGGEWEFDTAWRPTPSFPVRAGWLRAVIAGHAQVARGLRIDAPVLILLARRSLISARWSEEMRAADIVLDVDAIARRTANLGDLVTLARITDGVHDLALSAARPRAQFYGHLTRWTSAYGWV